ncbi:hypothetical protein CPC08DRAFT_197682 [Agrocybe pediades]|nr:hypothetical protein CPC08DRAFT_197682 [Agrocybe pediades]
MEEHIPSQHEDGVKKTRGGTKPLPDLPPELHEVIANNLEGDKNALKQCALTCQLYRPLAQKILFETVVFRVSADFNSADRFLDNVLKASPQIGGYVKLLSICEVNPYSSPDTGNQMVESMPLVVPAFVNLVDLVLGGALYKFQFSHLKPASQEAIINKCESLRGSLTLRHIDDVPLRIFRHLQRVETFNINNVSFVSDGHDEQVAEQRLYAGRIKRMKLGDATMDKSGTIYQFFKKEGFGVGYLESLSMDMNQRGLQALPATDFEAARWLIRGNAASLRVLDVSISGNGASPIFNGRFFFRTYLGTYAHKIQCL